MQFLKLFAVDFGGTFVHRAYGKGILQNAGSVSHSEAMKKVGAEYAKYRQSNLTPVEKEYINAVKSINLKLKDKGKI